MNSHKIPLNAAKVINSQATANPSDTAPAPDCFVVPRLFDSEGRVVETATTTLQPGKTCQLVFAETTNPLLRKPQTNPTDTSPGSD